MNFKINKLNLMKSAESVFGGMKSVNSTLRL